MSLEVRSVNSHGRKVLHWKGPGDLWAWICLFLHLGADDTGVFTLGRFLGLYTYDMHFYLSIYYTSIRSFLEKKKKK